MLRDKFFVLFAFILLIACENESRLSPVDINEPQKDSTLMPLYADYYVSDNFVINNTGKNIEIYVKNSFLIIPSEDDYLGKELELEKIVVKSPSEHKIKGEHFPLELQFHHKDTTGKTVLVAVFVNEGIENAEFQYIIDNIPQKDKPQKIELPIDVYYLFPAGQNYWTYEGSFTDKPYEQNITWYIMQEPIQLSKNQIDAISNSIGKNKKEVVDLGERTILEF